MKSLKNKLPGVIFAICLLAAFLLSGTYEQGNIGIAKYLIFSAADFAVLIWSGRKARILSR